LFRGVQHRGDDSKKDWASLAARRQFGKLILRRRQKMAGKKRLNVLAFGLAFGISCAVYIFLIGAVA